MLMIGQFTLMAVIVTQSLIAKVSIEHIRSKTMSGGRALTRSRSKTATDFQVRFQPHIH